MYFDSAACCGVVICLSLSYFEVRIFHVFSLQVVYNTKEAKLSPPLSPAQRDISECPIPCERSRSSVRTQRRCWPVVSSLESSPSFRQRDCVAFHSSQLTTKLAISSDTLQRRATPTPTRAVTISKVNRHGQTSRPIRPSSPPFLLSLSQPASSQASHL